MPSTGSDFTPRDVGEECLLSIDFGSNLGPGETLASATAQMLLLSGTDASPSSRLVGLPLIAGTIVSQLVTFTGLVMTQASPRNNYRLIIRVTTSLSQTISAWSQIQCSDPTLVA